MKKIIKILRTLSVKMTWKMFGALVSKPLLLMPTIWATVEAFLFSEVNFDGSSGGRGLPNAFRHAAWNLLIAKNCAAFTSNDKAVAWAKFITDLHEDCFPNDAFDREMDLHNNRIGREVYVELNRQKISKKEMITNLMGNSKTAIGLTGLDEIENVIDQLVYYKTTS